MNPTTDKFYQQMMTKVLPDDRGQAESLTKSFAFALERAGAKVEWKRNHREVVIYTLRRGTQLSDSSHWMLTCTWSAEGFGSVFPVKLASLNRDGFLECPTPQSLEEALTELAGTDEVARAIVTSRCP